MELEIGGYMKTVQIKSNISAKDNTRFELRCETITPPRCNSKEVYTVLMHFENSDGSTCTRPLVEFEQHGRGPKLLQKDDIYNCVYYSDNDQKLDVLDNLRSGCEDQFDEGPPTAEWENIINKIKELEKLIAKV